MEYYAGIDVSLEQSSVCVVDATGRIVREAKVASEPEALVGFFVQLGLPLARVGLGAGPLSRWLHAGLAQAGFEAVLLETRQVKAALSAMVVKTGRKDARGIAQLLRMGWYRPVHRKSPPAQEVRALLVGRKLLQGKLLAGELSGGASFFPAPRAAGAGGRRTRSWSSARAGAGRSRSGPRSGRGPAPPSVAGAPARRPSAP